jgi:hypothetical protein
LEATMRTILAVWASLVITSAATLIIALLD